MRLEYRMFLKSPPLTLPAGSAPATEQSFSREWRH